MEDFDATLYGSPLFQAVTSDAPYLEKLADFYSEAMVGWPDIHPSVINQTLSKHIIMANSDPGIKTFQYHQSVVNNYTGLFIYLIGLFIF